jgi:hypothetical protein
MPQYQGFHFTTFITENLRSPLNRRHRLGVQKGAIRAPQEKVNNVNICPVVAIGLCYQYDMHNGGR